MKFFTPNIFRCLFFFFICFWTAVTTNFFYYILCSFLYTVLPLASCLSCVSTFCFPMCLVLREESTGIRLRGWDWGEALDRGSLFWLFPKILLFLFTLQKNIGANLSSGCWEFFFKKKLYKHCFDLMFGVRVLSYSLKKNVLNWYFTVLKTPSQIFSC